MSVLPALHPNQYTDPNVYHKELQTLFRNQWLLAGHTSQLPPRTQLATTIAGIPILLWHTKKGIRAFANVCRHRGSPLVWEGEVQTGWKVRCRYHGWIYDDTGTLKNNTDFGLPCEQLQLISLSVSILHGWVFIAWEPPDESPLEWYPTLSHHLSEEMSEWTIRSTKRHQLKCNWKVYVENYLEGYHIPYLHPSLTKEISLDKYEIKVQNREIQHIVPTNENATNNGLWIYCWPNLAFNIYQNGLSVERVLPISASETVIEYWYCFPPETTDKMVEESIEMSTIVTQEDIQIVEAIHQNLASGLHTAGPLSPKHELGVAAFQNWVKNTY